MKSLESDTIARKTLRARDLPKSWNITVPGGPDAPITVIVKTGGHRKRPLASYVGAFGGAHGSAQEVNKHIGQLRDEWDDLDRHGGATRSDQRTS